MESRWRSPGFGKSKPLRSLWCLVALHPPPGEEKPLYAAVSRHRLSCQFGLGNYFETIFVSKPDSTVGFLQMPQPVQKWNFPSKKDPFLIAKQGRVSGRASRLASAQFCRCSWLDAWAATACSCWRSSMSRWRKIKLSSSSCKAWRGDQYGCT